MEISGSILRKTNYTPDVHTYIRECSIIIDIDFDTRWRINFSDAAAISQGPVSGWVNQKLLS